MNSIQMDSKPAGEGCAAGLAAEIPAGTSLAVYLLDYIDSQREPAVQTFRGTAAGPVKVGGRIIISSGARVILQLTGQEERRLDVVGVQLGKEAWARTEPAAVPAKGGDAALMEMSLQQGTPPNPWRLLIPSKTRLLFVTKQAIRLQPEAN